MRAALTVLVTAAVLAGCGGGEGAQADRSTLKLDAYGCPDLTGTYAFAAPGEGGVSFEGSIFESVPSEHGAVIPAKQVSGLAIQRDAYGGYTLRFFVSDERVSQHLKVIREFEKPRYREWYYLLSDPQRSRYIERNGAQAYERHLAGLGPVAEVVRELKNGSGMICRDGWVEVPRAYRKPIRLTLAEDGSIIGESREIDTVGVSVWCGDGCKEVPIPVGKHTGRLRWPRNDDLRPWNPAAIAAGRGFERPLDEIEAEIAARDRAQRDADANRYRTADAIRADLVAMAPPGTEIELVEVRGGKVHIHYSAPKEQIDVLLGTIASAGGNRDAPQEVQHGVRSSDFSRRFVRFVLTDSPLVLRNDHGSGATNADPASTVAPGANAPVVAASTKAVPPPQVDTLYASPTETPAGFAPPDVVRKRLSALMPSGCRVTDVKLREGVATVHGEAASSACISNALRAIEGARTGSDAGPDLVSMESGGSGYRFVIQLKPSSLTKP